jgi:hypothetical protein
MQIDVKVLAAALSAAINLILITFVSLRNRHHIVYRSFVLICFCLLMWNLRVIVSHNFPLSDANPIYAVIITHIFYTAVTACLYVLPVAALQFTAVFIGLDSKRVHNIIRTTYLAAFGLSFTYALDIFPATTYNYLLWIFTLPLFTFSFLLIGRAYIQSQRPLERTRLGLLLVAGSVAVTGAIAEDILTSNGVNIEGVGNIANAAYSLIVAVCLFRHRLFNIQVTTKRTLSTAFATLLLLALSYIASIILQPLIPLPYVYIFFTAALLFLFVRKLVMFSEKLLFGESKYLSQTIDEMRRALDQARSVNDLLRTSVELARENLGITRCICLGRNDTTGRYQFYWPPDADIDQMIRTRSFNNLVKWMASRQKDEPLVYDELCHLANFGGDDPGDMKKITKAIDDLKSIGYEIYAPFMLEHRLEGMMCLG